MMVWNYVREVWKSWELKAASQRKLQEQLLELVERQQGGTVRESDDWIPIGQGGVCRKSAGSRDDLLARSRYAVATNPHAKNILRMYEVYVAGPGLKLTHTPRCQDETGCYREQSRLADRLWREFLEHNHQHFSYREFGRRLWRDGECFVRKFPQLSWPVSVRFVDPERICETPEFAGSEGIVHRDEDVESVEGYVIADGSGTRGQVIDACWMQHSKYGVDSNQKRGEPLLGAILDNIAQFENWMEIELAARKLQTSIVLWRKVSGGPSQVAGLADEVASGRGGSGSQERRERFKPGTIVTTSQGTEMKFLQPDTNFGDALPLGRLLSLCTSSGVGLPEFMVTSDASNSNYASTMVSEGPAVKVFEAEQEFLLGELNRLWRWVMQEAVVLGLLGGEFFEVVEPVWSKPKLVVKDRPREREADVKLVESKIISRAEVARREGLEPERMRGEIFTEEESGV